MKSAHITEYTKIALLLISMTYLLSLTGCTYVEQHTLPKPKFMPIKYPEIPQDIPSPIEHTLTLPKPSTPQSPKTYTVIVDNVPIKELLFSIARNAQLNLDIDNNIEGSITLNAIEQTLPNILDRISELVSIRYSIDNKNIRIRNDAPYLEVYRLNYLNISRDSRSNTTVSTLISATGQGANEESGSGDSDSNNNSNTQVSNLSEHHFWQTITTNINAILYEEEDKEIEDSEKTENITENSENATEESSFDAAQNDINHNVIVNKEAGIIAVKANQKQHKMISRFLTEVLTSVKRQVLIEATIAEVSLSDRYQAGIDWQILQAGGSNALANFSNPSGLNIIQNMSGANLSNAPNFFLRLTETSIGDNRLDATLKALEEFGEVSIMSSPKILTLNNQTALLKVVDNIVYFSVDIDRTVGDGGVVTTDFETNIHTVPVGFVMSVTPYVDEFNTVTLNVRPTISRIIGQVKDPNPDLAKEDVISEIPLIQVREVESILKVHTGETAVIGGLMQDNDSKNTSGVPYLSRLPGVGNLFKYKDNENTKTELVIFIRPQVITEPAFITSEPNNASINTTASYIN